MGKLNIQEKNNCCGCGACLNACPCEAIAMKADFEGFSYPDIDENRCIACGLCGNICPVLNPVPEKPFSQRCFIVQHSDKNILAESTSGGAFTGLAESILGKGGVVFGAAFDENFKVQHRYIEKSAKLGSFRNSKYVQSDTGGSFRQAKTFLDAGRHVLFSGAPCQIALCAV
ncbi:MAG: 4Fe-4S dicluster domain-containing protein [Clostridiales bacterium]|nr:4Fe-4S dicluster domain-containing protein [Clostridiales bacterium]